MRSDTIWRIVSGADSWIGSGRAASSAKTLSCSDAAAGLRFMRAIVLRPSYGRRRHRVHQRSPFRGRFLPLPQEHEELAIAVRTNDW